MLFKSDIFILSFSVVWWDVNNLQRSSTTDCLYFFLKQNFLIIFDFLQMILRKILYFLEKFIGKTYEMYIGD